MVLPHLDCLIYRARQLPNLYTQHRNRQKPSTRVKILCKWTMASRGHSRESTPYCRGRCPLLEWWSLYVPLPRQIEMIKQLPYEGVQWSRCAYRKLPNTRAGNTEVVSSWNIRLMMEYVCSNTFANSMIRTIWLECLRRSKGRECYPYVTCFVC